MKRRPVRDPGLQPERTLLSWQRTIFLIIVVAMLYLGGLFQPGVPGTGADSDPLYRVVAAALMVSVAGVLIVHVRRRWRVAGSGRDGGPAGPPIAPVARPWAFFLVSLASAGLGVLVAAGAVLG